MYPCYSVIFSAIFTLLLLFSKAQAEDPRAQPARAGERIRHSAAQMNGFGASSSGGGLKFQPGAVPTVLKPASGSSVGGSGSKPDATPASEAATAPLADTLSPTAQVVSPVEGSTVSGSVALMAQASDDVGVVKVEFYLDGAGPSLSTSTANPYFSVFNSTQAFNGAHTLTAKAYDAAGNLSSHTVTLYVLNAPKAL